MMEYGAKFTKLSWFQRHLENKEQRKVDRFEDGLDIQIRKGLLSQTFTRFWKVYERAIWI